MLFDERNTEGLDESQRKALSGAYTILFAKAVRSGVYAEEGVESFGDRLKQALSKQILGGAKTQQELLEGYAPLPAIKSAVHFDVLVLASDAEVKPESKRAAKR